MALGKSCEYSRIKKWWVKTGKQTGASGTPKMYEGFQVNKDDIGFQYGMPYSTLTT